MTVSLAYDGASRMISASDSASTFSDTYSYNGLSQRVGKVDNTGTFSDTFADDSIDSLALADGAATYNYGANGNALISENRGGASKYYHSDGLGSTTALTNSSESTTDTRLTDSFGNLITSSGSTPTPFGFGVQSGYQADSDTGLKLCGARYYDSSAGRFLSRDPAFSGTNWYTYCGNDPVDGMDPTGLDVGWANNPQPWDPYGTGVPYGTISAPTATPTPEPSESLGQYYAQTMAWATSQGIGQDASLSNPSPSEDAASQGEGDEGDSDASTPFPTEMESTAELEAFVSCLPTSTNDFVFHYSNAPNLNETGLSAGTFVTDLQPQTPDIQEMIGALMSGTRSYVYAVDVTDMPEDAIEYVGPGSGGASDQRLLQPVPPNKVIGPARLPTPGPR